MYLLQPSFNSPGNPPPPYVGPQKPLQFFAAAVGDNEGASSEGDEFLENNEDALNVAAVALLDEDDHKKMDEVHLEGDDKMDNETTIELEEILGCDMFYQDKINLLKREGEMTIDKLRAMYTDMDKDVEEDNK